MSLASTSYVAPDAIVTAVLSANVPETFKVPALIVVIPIYVLLPDKVKVPELDFVSVPLPLMTPAKV